MQRIRPPSRVGDESGWSLLLSPTGPTLATEKPRSHRFLISPEWRGVARPATGLRCFSSFHPSRVAGVFCIARRLALMEMACRLRRVKMRGRPTPDTPLPGSPDLPIRRRRRFVKMRAFCLEGHTMATVTLEEAQANLPDLIYKLGTGEELAITEGNQVVAGLVGERRPLRQRPGPGLCAGMMTIVSDDDHLQEFAAYMP